MKLFVMGLTSSGKTYQSKALSRHFNLKYVSGSNLLLEMLQYAPDRSTHFVLGQAGERLSALRRGGEVDREVDRQLRFLAENIPNTVFDSWTLPFICSPSDSLRIYLNPTVSARARMAFGSRPEKPHSVAYLATLIAKVDADNRERFRELHGIDVFDPAGFDFVLDTSTSSADETSAGLIEFVTKSVWGRKQAA
jgi:cytidylate kinase